ncbi:MAG: hypothetical protein B7C24_10770 [Bacteroidetes bacterium 4572_77]|nr:MAG: hypothetical protein B7C24_10770 [Bacteroidetes bacterium 4572_77]
MKKIHQFSVLLLLISLVSCNEITTVSRQASTGGINEILVVTNNLNQWKGEIGDSIRSTFTQDMLLLPIPEDEFKLVNIDDAAIEKDLFKKHHNIFIVNIDPKIKDAFVETRTDLWAKPQIIIKVNAPNLHEFMVSFEELKENAFDLYVKNERERISTSYSSKFKNINISKALKKHFHIDMNIPKGYSIANINDSKAWIRKETAANSMNILVSVRPYQSTKDFDYIQVKRNRNDLTRTYIPGSVPGSYQTISDEYFDPILKEISFNDMFAVEFRGLWRVENDFMGGPFISYTFVDEKRKKLISIDGFMYAPKQRKAPLMRELEAILWSVKILP